MAAAILGNAVEWFDILVYAYFVKAIAANFFPASDNASSLLLAYGTFGLSFVARPLGAIVLGRIADRVGRRTALVYASALMFLGTAIIALLPSFETIGMIAPIMLLVARLMQGFSVGGEFGSAAAYLAEQSEGRRALYSSLQFASQGLGMLSAALVGLTLSSLMSDAEFVEWGWRVPFVIGAMLGPIVYIIRRNADETSEFLAAEAESSTKEHFRLAPFLGRCAMGAGAVLACTVTIYFLVYVPTFAQTSLGAGPAIAYTTAVISGGTLLVVAPIAGMIADRIGALRHGILAAAAVILITYPVFALMIASPDESTILLCQLALSIATAMYVGPLPAILAELFDTRNRSLGLAISYNVAVTTGGGFAQMIFVLLITMTGSIHAPSYYVVFAGAVSLASLLLCRRMNALDRGMARV
ncbi:MFS transporter [Sphingomonas sp. Root710]|uniref:MFS transporter n=1 Tax=Sphingomonas sp. Root710 TaxID=1736594 RepID=UPI00138F0BF9|nr:MFS transporter [Sphingomonas sp. Root710]